MHEFVRGAQLVNLNVTAAVLVLKLRGTTGFDPTMSHIQVAPPLKSEQFLTEGDSESLTAMSTEHCWRSGLFPNRSGDSWFPLRVASSLGRKRGWAGVGGDPPAQNGRG
jgi:hypothetical protein